MGWKEREAVTKAKSGLGSAGTSKPLFEANIDKDSHADLVDVFIETKVPKKIYK